VVHGNGLNSSKEKKDLVTLEIVSFILKIIEKGFEYEFNRSMHYDVVKYSWNEGQTNGKLEPEPFGNEGKVESCLSK